jgi:hypothetical protein
LAPSVERSVAELTVDTTVELPAVGIALTVPMGATLVEDAGARVETTE